MDEDDRRFVTIVTLNRTTWIFFTLTLLYFSSSLAALVHIRDKGKDEEEEEEEEKGVAEAR
ncbi:hypothetical protein E2C01_079624 [Portunus trituberculatus]|uniref:Uncharacterized protein n=1 Tax=Portunus trituberculatus TaxID=210409 RepID=A0A5B7IR39_PORTR|nr:hypothetical protein [Portunus trituberculatus]